MKNQLFSELSHSIERTFQIGENIARLALEYRVNFAALYGDLGAGKTALTRGLTSILAPGAYVCSPTYAVVNEYYPDKGEKISDNQEKCQTLPVFHFDMYRITDEDALDSIGFYDYMNRGGFIVTEWSENIPDALPERYFEVKLEKISDDVRLISVYLVDN
jgi:tRNA threonylcarbamoyladenosine biosynthesis protein TsaE